MNENATFSEGGDDWTAMGAPSAIPAATTDFDSFPQ